MNAWLLVEGWVLCGVFGYGLTLHDFTRQFPWMPNRAPARIVGIFGPLGLLVALLLSEQYGLRFRHLSDEERFERFRREFPDADRKEFERYR